MPMKNPSHPGRIIKDALENLPMTVTAFAAHIGISRVNVSRLLNGKAGITADMALKLGEAFPNQDAELWLRMQMAYDLAQARKKKRRKIEQLYPELET